METIQLETDILILGGGAAGCYAAITLQDTAPDVKVLIVEKANIKRSGCLAAGVNALNAYIVPGKTPEFYVDYAKKDAHGIVREDLLLSMSQRLNRVTHRLEHMGLVILKDENGKYVTRGNRNIKINGENIKPILADAVETCPNVTVLNHVNAVEYIVEDNTIAGVFANGVLEEKLYVIRCKACICATGGAAGLYRPNNPGFSRHKMWYPPFNTGAGYAMGIRAGAEMTTFEMRFIALRCKDTIAPTGTLAQGVGAKQVNAKGEVYEQKYGLTTSQRVYGTVMENKEGRGPCYLRTKGISAEQADSLKRAYLNMAPSQTLKWLENGSSPDEENVEIEGTEPYIIGGHTASGYWVDANRMSTIDGLFAAGDVAGGSPQKYVTGALAEGEIAAEAAAKYAHKQLKPAPADYIEQQAQAVGKYFTNISLFTTEQLEEAMQGVMDRYAGGISTDYGFTESGLQLADRKIQRLIQLSESIRVSDMQELTRLFELQERLLVCRAVIAHLADRKETRWHCFAENLDYPETDDTWLQYVNSRYADGTFHMLHRELTGRYETYEHTH
ncbi:MAG: adenylyl-sulfate reductase subunit alpha [Eubacteriales bacterium]|nr:adenylyl-sulfate reductase subunit alpha [Eubacteriales bacterium]